MFILNCKAMSQIHPLVPRHRTVLPSQNGTLQNTNFLECLIVQHLEWYCYHIDNVVSAYIVEIFLFISDLLCGIFPICALLYLDIFILGEFFSIFAHLDIFYSRTFGWKLFY